jgi:hypothetical protein
VHKQRLQEFSRWRSKLRDRQLQRKRHEHARRKLLKLAEGLGLRQQPDEQRILAEGDMRNIRKLHLLHHIPVLLQRLGLPPRLFERKKLQHRDSKRQLPPKRNLHWSKLLQPEH